MLPFEPRRPFLSLRGFELTLLEAAAGLTCLGLLWSNRRRLARLLPHPPAPLVFVALLAGAHALSAWRAPLHSDLALRFALRMTAMAAFAWLVASARPSARHAGLWGLCAGTTLVAALAVVEGMGYQGLDGFLDLFREMPFRVAGTVRATAGSEYPNLAAAFLAAGLACAAGLLSAHRRPIPLALPLCVIYSVALLLTYSRGGLLGATAALVILAALGRARRQVRLPILALALLLATSAALVATGDLFRLRVSMESTQSRYGFVYEPLEATLRLEPGETRRTRVRLVNSGPVAWRASGRLHLSYHWYGPGWSRLVEGGRTPLHRDLAAGESVVMDAELRAPEKPGHYLLVWDMVQDPALWFSGQGVRPKAVAVTVGQGTVPDASGAVIPMPEVGWHPSREELWSLALDMWRKRPATGVGSDNFRRLYGPWAGRPFWDTRIFANNLYLETAATTGTLGLLALLATLASAVFRSARSALRDPSGSRRALHAAILLALTGEVVVHGLIDYFLAFTGHYLLFGFLVGASAAIAPGEEAA